MSQPENSLQIQDIPAVHLENNLVSQNDEPVSTGRKRFREYELDSDEFDSDSGDESESVSDSSKETSSTSVQEIVETTQPPTLTRQDAKVGDSLLQAMGPRQGKICMRKLFGKKNSGKRCQNKPVSYGMCRYHWKKWKKANPWLKRPGH